MNLKGRPTTFGQHLAVAGKEYMEEEQRIKEDKEYCKCGAPLVMGVCAAYDA